MSKCKPLFTYILVSVLILWVLLGAITLPNANKWFKPDGLTIQEDFVTLDTKITDLNDAIVDKDKGRSFKANVFQVANTPNVPSNGIQGILYDKGDSCEKNDPTVGPISAYVQIHNISKIALIRQSQDCFLADKIMRAQLDGAVAAIVYNNVSMSDDSSVKQSGIGVMAKTVSIPAYYIDFDAGMVLLRDLQNAFNVNKNTSPSLNASGVLIRATLLPSAKPTLDHWQFALIIVGVMVILSVLIITIMQCHMLRIARQQSQNNTDNNYQLTSEEQNQLNNTNEAFWRGIIGGNPAPANRAGNTGPAIKYRLDQSLVDLLPTRVYKADEVMNGSTTLSLNEKSDCSSINNEKTISNNTIPTTVSVDSFGTTCELSTCVICLDNFEAGDTLRRMQCNHEYHRDCIDVWLTKKSGSCPLCLQQVQIPTVPDESHSRTEDESRIQINMPDLAETWNMMTRDEEVVIRQHVSSVLQHPQTTTNNQDSNNPS